MKKRNLKTRTSRRPLSTLSKVTIAALVINACAELFGLFAQLIFGGFVSIPLIISAILLIAAGLIATGKRWALVLSVLVILVTSVLTLTRPSNSYALLHPVGDNVAQAVAMVVILLSAVVAIAAGITAIMQNNLGSQQLASRGQEKA